MRETPRTAISIRAGGQQLTRRRGSGGTVTDITLADLTAAGSRGVGCGVLYRVPAAQRQRQAIDWLADQASGYFLFEPMGGVTEVRRLP